jgi:hypothetical protein
MFQPETPTIPECRDRVCHPEDPSLPEGTTKPCGATMPTQSPDAAYSFCTALLPTMPRMTSIGTKRALAKHLTAAREVQHWIYFRSEPARALFRDAATAAGLGFVSESSSKGELPFGIVVARTQPIEQNSIDRTVIELLNLSRRFDGDYDGWETPIVAQ